MRSGAVAASLRAPSAIVAIPAKDEAGRIGACLAALAIQRGADGAPLPAGTFEVLVLANNCTDGTVAEVERWAALSPHRITAVTATLPPARANAGWARKTAMDRAADAIAKAGHGDGVIMTTDADSSVSPTWVAATLSALAHGADAVAGYVDAHAAEIVSLGAAFMHRGRLEDHYLRLIAEIHARCDPRAHNPWPTHRVSSGASLAVSLRAYRAIGGLPAVPVGEDAALTRALEEHGFRVRHAMDVTVSTSCRFDGRAGGGAADTMRDRHANPDAPCDADIEPARAVLRRAALKGRLRRWHAEGAVADEMALPRRLCLTAADTTALPDLLRTSPFEAGWTFVSRMSPKLSRGAPLTPADLPAEIRHAERLLRLLRDAPLPSGPGFTAPVEARHAAAPLASGRRRALRL